MFPTAHVQCRQAFEEAAISAGAELTRYPVDLVGPEGEPLWISVARLGPLGAQRTAVVMSGVHGVEGPAGSAQQTAALRRGVSPAADASVVMIHAVNPWGMAWLRRQNERNVDLNRNWVTDHLDRRNDAYAAVHELLCPEGADLPAADDFVRALADLSGRHGLDWVRRAVSSGQYTHPTGLYFGGTELESSTLLLRRIADEQIGACAELCILDLHTGHGAPGAATILARGAGGSEEAVWAERTFPGERIDIADVASSDLVSKSGGLAAGIVAHVRPASGRTATLEIGTRSETRMIVAERAEHWVHRHGDRSNPAHRQVVLDHLRCSIPEDPAWHEAALEHGRRVLVRFLAAAAGAA